MPAAFAIALFLLAQQPTGSVFDQGASAFGAGDFKAAERLLAQTVKAHPESFQARFLLGATLVQLGRSGDAIAQLREAHRLDPLHADALKLLATQYMAVRDYRRAAALLKPATGDEEVYLLLIESLQSSGDTAESAAYARKAIARFPSSARLNCWMGFQLQFSGRYAEAKPYVEKAIRLSPDYAAGQFLMADLLVKQQEPGEALPYFRKAIAGAPDDIDARLGFSQALVALEHLEEALEQLLQAVRIAPAEPRVHFQLSRLYFRFGDQKKAEEEAALSVKLRPAQPLLTAPPAALRAPGPR
jgi:tetratricopeptide (TPR) repeat protein